MLALPETSPAEAGANMTSELKVDTPGVFSAEEEFEQAKDD